MAQTHSSDLERSSSQYAYISDGSQTGLALSTDFTIEAWIKLEQLPSSAGGGFVIAGKSSATGLNRSYGFTVNASDKLRVFYSDDGNYVSGSMEIIDSVSALTSADVGVWIHVAVTVDISAQTATMYKNGQSISTTEFQSGGTTIFDTNANFEIGNDSQDNVQLFDGLIKDVRVFSDIRTASEIVTDAHTESVSNANLEGEWNLNNDYTDGSGNGNTLTASGSPVFSTNIPWEGAVGIDGSTYLETNLEAYFALEEASGTRLDETANNNDLADQNTVGQTTGKVDNAALAASASSEYLKIANASQSAGLKSGGTFSVSYWMKLTSAMSTTQGAGSVVWSNNNSAQDGAYSQMWQPAGTSTEINLRIRQDASTTEDDVWTSPVHMSTGTWYHVVIVADFANSVAEVFVNGISAGVNTLTSTTQMATTGPFCLFTYRDGASNFFDGAFDEYAFYKRALHYGDVLDLYNDGSGIGYTGVINISVSPSAQVATFSLPAETVKLGTSISVGVQTATFSLPASSLILGTTVSPSAQVATFSIPVYTVDLPDVTTFPSAQVATFSLPAETVKLGNTISVGVQTATFTIQSAIIGLSSIISVATQVLTFAIPTLVRVGAIWRKTARATDSTWGRTSRNSD